MLPEGVHVNLAFGPNVVYTSINLRNNKFFAYIYIPFNHNHDKKSYMSAKIIYTQFFC